MVAKGQDSAPHHRNTPRLHAGKTGNIGKREYAETRNEKSQTRGEKTFEDILTKHETGEKPLHRDREYKKEERKKAKENKVKSWYKKSRQHDSVMFIPITPGGVLKERIQKRIEGGNLKIKLVEFTGPKIIDIVKQKVGGGRDDRCGQEDCFVCSGENAKNCRKKMLSTRLSAKLVQQMESAVSTLGRQEIAATNVANPTLLNTGQLILRLERKVY